jgi:hypothetical protein
MRSVLCLLLVAATQCDAQAPPPSQHSAPQSGIELRGDTVVMTTSRAVLKYVRRGDTVVVRREEHGRFLHEQRWLVQGDSAIAIGAPRRGRMAVQASVVLFPWVAAKGQQTMDSLMRVRGRSP